MTYGTDWTDYDFRPAPPGWRLAYLTDSPLGYFTIAMPGWMVQVETRYNLVTSATQDPPPLADRPRRVAAATSYGDGTIEAVEGGDSSNFWQVIDPTNPEPTTDQAAAERARLARGQLEAVSTP